MTNKSKKATKGSPVLSDKEKEPIKAPNTLNQPEFKIEKGVPIPDRSERDSLVSRFPLQFMEIMDSFLVDKPHTRVFQNSLSCSIRQFCKAKKIKAKFSVFKDAETGKIRIWRKE